MYKRIILSVLLAVCIVFMGANLRADDDSIRDVDNNNYPSGTFTITGTWNSSSHSSQYGTNYRYAYGAGSTASTATRTAQFKTAKTTDITGKYQVFVRWVASSANDTSVRFRIYDGTSYRGYCTLNQTKNGGEWVFCKETTLTSGRKGIVKLGNEYCATNKRVVADAVRFVRVSVDDYDIVDEAGIEYTGSGSKSITQISSNSSSWTNLKTLYVSAPSSGYVLVLASGIAKLTATDRWVRVGLSNVSGGSSFSGLAPFLENIADEKNAGSYENERRYALQEVFYVSSKGLKKFYLKACREAGATGTLMWNDVVAIFLPTRY